MCLKKFKTVLKRYPRLIVELYTTCERHQLNTPSITKSNRYRELVQNKKKCHVNFPEHTLYDLQAVTENEWEAVLSYCDMLRQIIHADMTKLGYKYYWNPNC